MVKDVNLFRIQVVAFVVSVILILVVFYLLKKRRLREEYSLLLLGGGVTVIIFSIWRDLLVKVSHFFGIAYPPSLLFILVLLFGIVIFIHFSIVISGLMDKNKRLTQRVALLEIEMENR